MGLPTIEELKEELSFTADLGTVDDALLTRHLEAARGVIERYLGYPLDEQTPPPAAVTQAVLWLAVDYYEGRGQAESKDALPFHVAEILAAYREWSF